MARYTTDELKTIGRSCSPTMPPTTIMRQMFEYELRRQEDNQRLFNHQMCQLARVEDDSGAIKQMIDEQKKAMKKLEYRVQQLAKESQPTDIVHKLTTAIDRVDTLEHNTAASSDAIHLLQKCLDDVGKMVPSTTIGTEITAFSTRLDLLNSKLSLIFTERNARNDRVAKAEERIAKLDDLVRCLTLQLSERDAIQAKPPVSRLPIDSPDKRPIDLVVPKGSPHVMYSKESRPVAKSLDLKQVLLSQVREFRPAAELMKQEHLQENHQPLQSIEEKQLPDIHSPVKPGSSKPALGIQPTAQLLGSISENSVGVASPQTSRSHLLAGLRTQPKTPAVPLPHQTQPISKPDKAEQVLEVRATSKLAENDSTTHSSLYGSMWAGRSLGM